MILLDPGEHSPEPYTSIIEQLIGGPEQTHTVASGGGNMPSGSSIQFKSSYGLFD